MLLRVTDHHYCIPMGVTHTRTQQQQEGLLPHVIVLKNMLQLIPNVQLEKITNVGGSQCYEIKIGLRRF